ncbi:MAG: AAA family ATPase [Anaerolineales bacterium]|nr:AAA family ATPase [Anaerolineales bacterium]
MPLLVLFGLPGAGKSYVGRLLAAEFGYHLHEADDDIPADYKRDVAAGQVVSDARRDAYHRLLLDRVAALRQEHPRLAVAVPLLRDRHRRWFLERFPDAVLVLVQCAPTPWAARLAQRTHTVGLDYARQVSALYQPPTVPHQRLDDSGDGPAGLRAQLARLLPSA